MLSRPSRSAGERASGRVQFRPEGLCHRLLPHARILPRSAQGQLTHHLFLKRQPHQMALRPCDTVTQDQVTLARYSHSSSAQVNAESVQEIPHRSEDKPARRRRKAGVWCGAITEKETSELGRFGSRAGQGAEKCRGEGDQLQPQRAAVATAQDLKRPESRFPPSSSSLDSALFGCSRAGPGHLISG